MSGVEAPTAVTVDDVIDGIGFGRWVVTKSAPLEPVPPCVHPPPFPRKRRVAGAIGEGLT